MRYLLLLWLVLGVFNTGAYYADIVNKLPYAHQKHEQRRESLAFAIGFGMIPAPFSFVMSPFLTGFYQHGWSLDINRVPELPKDN